MALVLPYPNLDFVPLDILTAEEMNEIVANYTFIANQFPIGSTNLDWTTLKGSTSIPVATGTLPTGFGGSLTMYRVGNLVTVADDTRIDGNGSWNTTTLSEVCPAGFKPIGRTMAYGSGADGGDYSPYILEILDTGAMTSLSLRSGEHGYTFNATWVTRDAWPSA